MARSHVTGSKNPAYFVFANLTGLCRVVSRQSVSFTKGRANVFTLILKDGRQISAERAEDVSTFWDKESSNREAAERKAKRNSGKKEKKA